MWTLIEDKTGIICACLPLLKRPLMILCPYMFRRGTSDRGARSTGPPQNAYELPSQRTTKVYAYPIGTVTSTRVTSASQGKSHCRSQSVDSEEDILSSQHDQSSGITRKTDFTIAYHREGAESLSSLSDEHPADVHI